MTTNVAPECYDYLIVGAGPAGLQMGQLLARAGRSYLILEAGEHPGAFFDRFPRHRRLISLNKRFNYFPEPDFNLRHDWNSILSDDEGPRFTNYSDKLFPVADDYVAYLGDYARHHQLDIRFDTRVEQIEPLSPRGYRIVDHAGRAYLTNCVLLATGAVAPWLPPDIEGIELADSYEDHSLDVEQYQGKRVAIIGQGNSAFEVANHLAGDAAMIHIFVKHPIRHSWTTHFPGDLRAINNTILDMYQLKSLHATLGRHITAIRPSPEGHFEVEMETDFPHWVPPRRTISTFVYDRVIRCTGWRYAVPGLFAGAAPAIDAKGKFFQLDATWQTSLQDVYCIGTSMQARDRKAATSFIHGFRYNVRTLFRLLEEKNFGVDLIDETVPLISDDEIRAFAQSLIQRISTTSALYQQFGVLGDIIVYENGQARVYRELPVDLVQVREEFRNAADLVQVTLEYGFHRYPSRQPLDFILPADFNRPECSAFIHPVLRHYRAGVLVEESHLTESLVVRYDVPFDKRLSAGGHENRIHNFFCRVTGNGTDVGEEAIFSPDIPEELLLESQVSSAAGTPDQAGLPCAFPPDI
jgi:thioredoxin reductase